MKQVNGIGQNSIPPHTKNPLTDLHRNWQAWLRHGWHPACKIK